MSEFKIGDIVEAIEPIDGEYNLIGKRGKVVKILPGDLGVEFFHSFFVGHSCGGTGKEGHCRYGRKDNFKKAGISNPNSDIIIKEV